MNTFLLGMFSQSPLQGPGVDTFSSHLMEILVMLTVAFILGYLLRYFIGAKYRNRVASLEAEVRQLQDDLAAARKRANNMEADLSGVRYEKEKVDGLLAECRSKSADLDIRLKACEEQKLALQADIVAPATTGIASGLAAGAVSKMAPTGYGAVLLNDNLQVVEGIGPKIETLLKDNGIQTWSALSETDSNRLKEILTGAGGQYRIHDPETWPKQAGLASGGQWEELIEYQKFLGGGKENSANIGNNPSKIEKMYLKAQGLKSFKPDDLKLVEGIGPKIEGLLKNAGIDTWADLAGTSVERIKEILAAAGDRYRLADPTTWPRQAELAANGQWAELKEYQDYLDGGRG